MDKGNGLLEDVRKTIDGLRYDTAKSEWIWTDTAGYPGEIDTDFNSFEEGLYITPRSRRYFLAGRGGAATKYARRVADGTVAGEKVFPLSKEAAYEWAERVMPSSLLDLYFSDMVEDA